MDMNGDTKGNYANLKSAATGPRCLHSRISPLLHTPRQLSESTGRLGVSQTVVSQVGQIGPQEPVTQLCPCPTCRIQHETELMKHIVNRH